MRSEKGITLIELLVVVVIVGILAAVAIPAYTNYLVRARRADPKVGLEQLRASQEMYRAERGSYSTSLTQLVTSFGVSANPVGDYNLSFVVANANSFTATATPFTSRQSSDGWLSINNNGVKCDQSGNCLPNQYCKWYK